MTTADIIIYSKDRACQLDLLLRSIAINFKNLNKVYILGDYSTPDYEKAYKTILSTYYGLNIVFKKQSRETFFSVMKDTVNSIETEFTLPLCDDDVFIRNTDITEVAKHVDDDTIGIHLRFSKDLTISYHTGKIYTLPEFIPIGEGMIKWDWTKYPIIDRWGYPYQAGGLIYRTSFFKHMVNNIHFHLPNSLETNMMGNRFGWGKKHIVGFDHSPIVNVSVNRVQNEVNNRGGRDINYSPVDLNNQFLSNKMIDYTQLQNYSNNCEFIEIPLNFVTKT